VNWLLVALARVFQAGRSRLGWDTLARSWSALFVRTVRC